MGRYLYLIFVYISLSPSNTSHKIVSLSRTSFKDLQRQSRQKQKQNKLNSTFADLGHSKVTTSNLILFFLDSIVLVEWYFYECCKNANTLNFTKNWAYILFHLYCDEFVKITFTEFDLHDFFSRPSLLKSGQSWPPKVNQLLELNSLAAIK